MSVALAALGGLLLGFVCALLIVFITFCYSMANLLDPKD